MTSLMILFLTACSVGGTNFDGEQMPPTDDILSVDVDEVSRSGLTISTTAGALVDQVWEIDVSSSLLARTVDTVTLEFGEPSSGYDVSRICNGNWSFRGLSCREGTFVAFPVAFTESTASGDFIASGEVLVAAYALDDASAILIHHDLDSGAFTNLDWIDLPAELGPSAVTLSEDVLTRLADVDAGSWSAASGTDLGPDQGVFQLYAYTDAGVEGGAVLAGDFSPPGLFD